MSTEKMTYQDLLQIVELIKSASHFGEFHLKMGELEVDLRRGADDAPRMPLIASPQKPATLDAGPAAQGKEKPGTKQRHGHVGGGEIVAEPAANASEGAAASSQGAPPPAYPPDAVLIKSPMVGTFYRAPEPGAPPFVEIGQLVESSTTVCIIEVMKLINSIPAGRKGCVTHILVEDGEPVEFGQLLMVIDPKQ